MNSRQQYYAVACCVLVGCVLRISSLDLHSLWFDEAASVYVARSEDLSEALAGDRHPPLFYWLLRHWMRIVGDGEAALRSLPALASCASLVLCAILCLWRCSPRHAWFACALLALSPFSLWYAQELRAYSFLELSGVLGLTAVASATNPAARPWSACVLAGLAAAVGIGSHYMGVVLLPALAVVAAVAWRRKQIDARAALELCAGALAGLAVWAPWLVRMLPRQLATPWPPLARLGWIDLAEFPVRLFLVELNRMPVGLRWLVWAVAACLYAALGAAVWFELRKRESLVGYVALYAATGIGAALVLALTISPNFLPRYLAACAPALVWSVAGGISAWPRRSFAAVAGLVLLAGAIVLDVELRSRNGKQDFRAACREVEAHWRAGDQVLALTGTFTGFAEAPVRYYLRDRPDIANTVVSEAALPRLLEERSADRRVHVVIYDAEYTRDAYAALLRAGVVTSEAQNSNDVRYVLIQLR
jgi:4-amino-4-deoxy-L-arabinose transferase-like glycosyltransferase